MVGHGTVRFQVVMMLSQWWSTRQLRILQVGKSWYLLRVRVGPYLRTTRGVWLHPTDCGKEGEGRKGFSPEENYRQSIEAEVPPTTSQFLISRMGQHDGGLGRKPDKNNIVLSSVFSIPNQYLMGGISFQTWLGMWVVTPMFYSPG